MARVSEISAFDSEEYKRVSRGALVGIFTNEIKKDLWNSEPFQKSSKIFHKQLKLISKKVSGKASTMEENLFTDFSMRIKDNLTILEKFDDELELMKQGNLYKAGALCSYLAVLSAELAGMLDSLEVSKGH